MLDDKLFTRREAPASHSRPDWSTYPSKTATALAVHELLLLFRLAVGGIEVTGKEGTDVQSHGARWKSS